MAPRFSFGENWKSFLKHLDEDRIERAKLELRDRFEMQSFEGQSFLDAGCGSGLFSLAAYRLGADRIYSFDYDEDSVECCRRLADRENADDWEIKHGDLLNSDFIDDLERFDMVYCWGVAHHTGNMWKAIDNLTVTLADDGLLCIGLYNSVNPSESFYHSKRAFQIKRLYHRLPSPFRRVMIFSYGLTHLTARTLVKLENPIRYVREYRENRGMEYWHDIEDWLGGLPFEYASSEEVQGHFLNNHPGFEHVKTNAPSNRPTTVNSFIFRRSCDDRNS